MDDFLSIVIGIFIVIVLIVVIGICSIGTGIIHFGSNQIQKTFNRTLDADTAFNNYEWFFTQYNDILAAKEKIKTAYDLSVQKNLSEEVQSMYQVNYSGQVNFIQSLASEYNAKSDMWNRTIFKNKSLPYKIHPSVKGGECTLSFE